VRPRGAAKFFRGVIAAPGDEPSVIAELAMAANRLGLLEEARALAAIVVAHPRATPDERSQATFAADSHDATPRDVSGAKRRIDDFCMSGLEFRYRMCRADVGTLAAMGGQSELRPLAETFLRHGRDRTAALRARTAAFGLASEAYRLTGNVKAALAAAREGLPLVEKVLFEGWKLDGPPERRIKLMAAAQAFEGATAPVIALYRAGARDEALATDFLTAYERFKNAAVAGEVPDPKWIADQGDLREVEALIDDLVATPDAATARQFHDALRCAATFSLEDGSGAFFDMARAAAAALGGRSTSMNAHLVSAAAVLDQFGGGYTVLIAHRLAMSWRRSLTIAERVAAVPDQPATCPIAHSQNTYYFP
jgi:hypothetical protein